ncbi:hypothetical protein [Streptomyces sp. NBC_01207]|uniref:hypothetical protein n=1 Tax=Streptomyces sp. NBC_01207 TaxID=2903772 RepID=UPI002E14C015|nr:hypothetical protein OG457_44610 [Streptomyces sp. NBC_01207]
MAYEPLTVCLPPTDVQQVREAVRRAMAPFDRMSEDVPWEQAEWDSWSLGTGRASFAVRPGAESDPQLMRIVEPPSHSARVPLPPSRCDGGPRRLLDLDTKRDAVAGRAHAEWRAWNDFARGFPPGRPMHELRWEYNAVHGLGPDDRFRGTYEQQDVIRAISANPEVAALVVDKGDPIRWFAEPEDDYVRRLSAEVNPSDALLTLDGRWLDISSDVYDEETKTDGSSYFEYADDYLRRVPDDCYLVRVRFHN